MIKNRMLASLFFISAVLMLLSCNEETDLPNLFESFPLENYIAARIDGQYWVADGGGGQVVEGFLAVSGQSYSGGSLVINMPAGLVQGGSVEFRYGNPYYLLWQGAPGGQGFITLFTPNDLQNGGSVTITDFDIEGRWVSGTFHGVGTASAGSGQLEVTDGVFYKIPYIFPDVNNPSADYLEVRINGVAWAAEIVTAELVQDIIIIRGESAATERAVEIQLPSGAAPENAEILGVKCILVFDVRQQKV